MADVTLSIGGHFYAVACREGEETHLANMGALIDAKTVEARAAVGSLSEVRQLLFAALLLADELTECRSQVAPSSAPDTRHLQLLQRIAGRLTAVASALEHSHG